jgi:acetyl esterase/lipase
VGDRKLELHVFNPPHHQPTDKAPVFVTIHGGGWTGGNPAVMYYFADYYAQRGYVGISVQYRLYDPKTNTTVEDCVKDVRSAVRYIRAHAGELGIDPNRMIVNGSSAGGHLALAIAMFDDINDEHDDLSIPTRPQVCIPFWPVIDTGEHGYGHAKAGANWQHISPVDRVTAGLPPTLIFHGTGDTTCPYAGSKLYLEKSLAADNRYELITHDGGKHGYFMFDKTLLHDAMSKMDGFLKSLGYPTEPVK